MAFTLKLKKQNKHLAATENNKVNDRVVWN